RCSFHRFTCVLVTCCMNAGRSPSRSGQTTKCQWLGITQQAHSRIRRVRSVSSTTRSNAKKSSSLVKSTLRPTPRLSAWKTIPAPDNVASVVTFTAFYEDIPALSISWLSPFHPVTFSPVQWLVRGTGGSSSGPGCPQRSQRRQCPSLLRRRVARYAAHPAQRFLKEAFRSSLQDSCRDIP